MTAAPPDYCAFVSYRHADPDRAWARWVVETLERWRTPRRLARERGLARRLGRAFQDEQELSAGPTLHAEIQRRLEASRFLIVICSPASRGRPWIEEEVRAFVRWGRGERILPLLVAGEAGASLPEALLERGAPADGREPLAADVRPVAGESLRERRRRAALQLLAPILGVDLDTLRRRDDQRRHRRLAALSGALGVVVLALALLAGWALRANARAQERLVALHEEQGRQAWLAGSPGQALVHLSEAYRLGGRSAGLRFLLARAAQAGERATAVLSAGGAALFDVAFSPDGALVALAGDDGCVRLFRARDGAPWREPCVRGPACRALAFSPDGSRLLASGADLAVRVYRVADGGLERTVRPPGEPDAASYLERRHLWQPQFLSGGTRFAVVGARRTRLLADLETGVARALPTPEGRPEEGSPEHYDWACAVRPDGARIATADQDGWLYLYDGDGRPVAPARRAHDSTVRALAWEPSGARLYSVGDDRHLACWSGEDGEPLWRARSPSAANAAWSVAVAARGPVAVGRDHGEVELFDRDDGHLVRVVDVHGARVTWLGMDHEGERLVTASLDGRAHVIAVRSGRVLTSLEGHVRGIQAAALAPDGDLLATASSDGTARLWPLAQIHGYGGHLVAEAVAPGAGSAPRFGPGGDAVLVAGLDGRLRAVSSRGLLVAGAALAGPVRVDRAAARGAVVVAAEARGDIYVWLPASGEPPRRLVRRATPCRGVAVLLDGRCATAHDDGVLRLWDVGDGALRAELRAQAPFACLGGSPDGRRLLLGCLDGSVWLWEEGADLRRLHGEHGKHVKQVALSTDGRLALSAGWDSKAVLWDVEHWRLRAVLRGHEGELTDCALDPAGRRAATAGQDGSVCLWSTDTGRLEHALAGPDGHRSLGRVVFSPDGALLVTFGADGLLRVWEASSGRLLGRLEGHAQIVQEAAFVPDGRAVVSRDDSGPTWWWDLSYETRPPAEVADFVRRHVPWSLDADGGLVRGR